jgi:hypothetical protein
MEAQSAEVQHWVGGPIVAHEVAGAGIVRHTM